MEIRAQKPLLKCNVRTLLSVKSWRAVSQDHACSSKSIEQFCDSKDCLKVQSLYCSPPPPGWGFSLKVSTGWRIETRGYRVLNGRGQTDGRYNGPLYLSLFIYDAGSVIDWDLTPFQPVPIHAFPPPRSCTLHLYYTFLTCLDPVGDSLPDGCAQI